MTTGYTEKVLRDLEFQPPYFFVKNPDGSESVGLRPDLHARLVYEMQAMEQAVKTGTNTYTNILGVPVFVTETLPTDKALVVDAEGKHHCTKCGTELPGNMKGLCSMCLCKKINKVRRLGKLK